MKEDAIGGNFKTRNIREDQYKNQSGSGREIAQGPVL
jgi:hypothetical protein